MNKLINKLGFLTIILSILFVSCETVDFGDENVNPNNPTSKRTDALLTNAITWMPNIVSTVTPNYYVQTLSDVTYTSASFTANGAMIYNTTTNGGSSTTDAVAIIAFGGDKTASNGTFKIEFPTADASNAIIRLA